MSTEIRRHVVHAERYRGWTSPDQVVGCIAVDDAGKVIAEAGTATRHRPWRPVYHRLARTYRARATQLRT